MIHRNLVEVVGSEEERGILIVVVDVVFDEMISRLDEKHGGSLRLSK